MPTTFQWVAPEAVSCALYTELNGLASGAYSAASAAINNETGLYQYVDLELILGSLTPIAGGYVQVDLEPSLDGTTYVNTGECNHMNQITVFGLDTGTACQSLERVNLPIPPLSFKFTVRNHAGVALAAGSLNALRYRRHNEQGV